MLESMCSVTGKHQCGGMSVGAGIDLMRCVIYERVAQASTRLAASQVSPNDDTVE